MIPLSCAVIAAAVDGELAGADPSALVTAPVAIDSRAVDPGGLFVAFAGVRADGHDHVAAAVAAGAVAALTSRPVDGSPCIVVADPQRALGRLARYVVDRLPGCVVIGLTGSQGKTSTKDLLAQVLATRGPTVAPAGSFNNEIGHPVSALRADAGTRFLVAEMGTRALGDIAYLTRITPPRIGLVLNVGVAHVGEFGDQDTIAVAKGELVEALPADGVAVLNADDPRVAAMASRTTARVVTFGMAPGAGVRAERVVLDEHGRAGFILHLAGEQHPVQLLLVGEHQVSNALGAAAAAHAVGLTPRQIAVALSAATATSRWRMEVADSADGVTVINDAYNAGPDSVRAALRALVAIGRARGGARTWAVLGEMRELGAASRREHDAVGRLAVRLGVDRLVAVAEAARPIQLGAEQEGAGGDEPVFVDGADAALDLLRHELRPGDIVLVKASRTIGLEKLADALLTGPRDPDAAP